MSVGCEGCGNGPCKYATREGYRSEPWDRCAVPKGEGATMTTVALEPSREVYSTFPKTGEIVPVYRGNMKRKFGC
jgi:hypothetical protein